MSDQFKPGDTVQLKSGGPIMTVTKIEPSIGGNGRALCEWFDGKHVPQNRYFEIVALIKAD